MPTVADVVALIADRYDPATAEPWDSVGLICGDPKDQVTRVLLAVDPVVAVVAEAIDVGAQLLVTHHPLFLRPVHSVAVNSGYKGRLVHRAIRAGLAMYAAHTNADHAVPGVSDAIASALGLREVEPLEPAGPRGTQLDKYLVMVPEADAQSVLAALAAAGAGQIGNYDRAAFLVPGTGTFRPLAGANPTIGSIGDVETVAEVQVQMIAPRALRAQVVRALIAAHPYEEPAYDILELQSPPWGGGTGRVGVLEHEVTLAEFAALVTRVLPSCAQGVRIAGDLEQSVRRVALCGGAGDSLLEVAARSGADVYLTSDLRHHRASEHLEAGGPALVDVSHWAAEWMWLPRAAALLRSDLAERGYHVDVQVSTTVTDPWTQHLPSGQAGSSPIPGSQEDS